MLANLIALQGQAGNVKDENGYTLYSFNTDMLCLSYCLLCQRNMLLFLKCKAFLGLSFVFLILLDIFYLIFLFAMSKTAHTYGDERQLTLGLSLIE